KVDGLLELLEELPPREQVVAFAVSRRLIELTQARLSEKNVASVVISGAVPEVQRYHAVDQFRAGLARVCLVVIQAGGEGLDGLQCAQVGVFMQRHYSRLMNRQAEGRLVRDGQEGQAVLIDLRSEGTIEDDKEALLALKEDRFEELVRDRAALRDLIARSMA
ncbi:MAG TPA: helicase-related protein, partial [Solirubrobacteraceae bacterium]|nr:helicase-related protein [Solirubrobacteraceae bacterium]